MRKIIFVTGIPGSGKTTLMLELKERLNINHENTFNEMHNRNIYYDNGNHVYLIGRYDKEFRFSGLDSCQRHRNSISNLIEHIYSLDNDCVIFCEGIYQINIKDSINIFLYVDDEILKERQIKRKVHFNFKMKDDKSMNDYISKWHHIFREENISKYNYEFLNNNTEEDFENNIKNL